MTTATLLAVVAIGLFGLIFGVLLALLGAMAWSLHRSAEKQKSLNDFAFKILTEQAMKLTGEMQTLKVDVAMNLAKMDSGRLFEASMAIQKSSKEMAHSVATFSKLLFAQQGASTGMAPMAGFPQQPLMDQAFSLEDERADDEYLAGQSGRWLGDQQIPMQQYQTSGYAQHYDQSPPQGPRRPFGMPASNLSQWPAADPAEYRGQQQASTLDIEQAMAHDYTPGATPADPFAALATPPSQGDMQE